MISIRDLAAMGEEERKKRQKGALKKLVIGTWAPREPEIMRAVYNAFARKQEFSGRLIARILDRLFSIGMYTQVVTYDEAVEFIRGLPESYLIARGPCACRVNTAEELGPDARDLPGGNLDFIRQTPLNVDIQFGICGEAFGRVEGYELISKQELLELERECRDRGLVSNIYLMLGGEGSICHCSSRTCVPLMAGRAVGGKTRFIKKGDYVAKTDMAACAGSGACARVCHFDARRMAEENGRAVMVYDFRKCFGCGLCASVCPENATTMVRRRDLKRGDLTAPPAP